eukprot:6205607-Pleurochrysis_carterae.AAC.1
MARARWRARGMQGVRTIGARQVSTRQSVCETEGSISIARGRARLRSCVCGTFAHMRVCATVRACSQASMRASYASTQVGAPSLQEPFWPRKDT